MILLFKTGQPQTFLYATTAEGSLDAKKGVKYDIAAAAVPAKTRLVSTFQASQLISSRIWS